MPNLVTLSQATKKVLPVASQVSSILNKYPHPEEKKIHGAAEKSRALSTGRNMISYVPLPASSSLKVTVLTAL